MTRKLLGALTLITGLYVLLAAILGPTKVIDGFTTLTAINQWHPNWPDQATVDSFARNSLPFVIAAALFLVLAYGCVALGKPLDLRPTPQTIFPTGGRAVIASSRAGGLRSLREYQPDMAQFHLNLIALLREAGVSADVATEAARKAVPEPESLRGRSVGEIRQLAFHEAGLTAPTINMQSLAPNLNETVQFLRDYGYQAVRLRHAWPSDDGQKHELNFNGIIVWHRTDAIAAESSLVELLITAHQAYMASVDDNGEPSLTRTVEERDAALTHVATKIALRGFVPPELDAQVGRDGTATAEELKGWAVAQVVSACSPMTRMPLPTIERTAGVA